MRDLLGEEQQREGGLERAREESAAPRGENTAAPEETMSLPILVRGLAVVYFVRKSLLGCRSCCRVEVSPHWSQQEVTREIIHQ